MYNLFIDDNIGITMTHHDIDWDRIAINSNLSEEFIREHEHKLDWGRISTWQKLSEKFIREFDHNLNWDYISASQKLSEAFIIEFKHRLNWRSISACQQLSESFISAHIDDLCMERVGATQTLSDEFCKSHSIQSNILKSVFYCGKSNRCICIHKSDPTIIHIGCFYGTKQEAIKRIKQDYNGQDVVDYIAKVNECFDFTTTKR